MGTLFQISIETQSNGNKQIEQFNCNHIDKLHRASCSFRTNGSLFQGAIKTSRYAMEDGSIHQDKRTIGQR